MELLAERDPQGVVTLPHELAQSAQPERRLQACHLLTAQGDEEVVGEALSAALGEGDLTVKRYAMQELAERGGPEALMFLEQALRDPNAVVRLAGLEYVGPMASGRSLLQGGPADEDADVHTMAAFWLKQIEAAR